MVENMKRVASSDQELTVEERNLLRVAYQNVIGACPGALSDWKQAFQLHSWCVVLLLPWDPVRTVGSRDFVPLRKRMTFVHVMRLGASSQELKSNKV